MRQAKSSFIVFLLSSLAAWCSVSVASSHDSEPLFPGNDQRHLSESGKYRFEFSNDLFSGTDNGFSNGWSFQIHTPVVEDWNKLHGPAPFVKRMASSLPTLSGNNLYYRAALSVGQVMQTPDELENPNPIPNDFPYAGILTGQLSLIAFNDDEFRGFGFVLGIVGRQSAAEQFQNFVHNITDSEIAKGWDNQLKNEPIINVNYMRKKKFYKSGGGAGMGFDAAIGGDVELGNLFTAAGVRLETRFGINMPGGYAFYSDPIGRYIAYDARLAPPEPKQASIYGSVGIQASAIAHHIGVDGNVIRDNPAHVDSIDKEEFVGVLMLGFHYEKPTWAFHFKFHMTTDVVDEATATSTPDTDNNYGTFLFEWRI